MGRVNLNSLDVDSLFQELRNTTGLFRVWKESGDDIVTQCPFHGGGNERKPSFGICNKRGNPNYGKYNCFACGASGTILSLVNKLHNKTEDDNFAIQFAQSVSSVEMYDDRNQISLLPRKKLEVLSSVSPNELQFYRNQKCDYLTKRKVDEKVQQAFDCGFDPISNAVTFPVRRKDGSCSFLVRRSVNLKWYNYPAGVKKPIYGIYELNKIFPGFKTVVIVESIINALTLWGLQIPSVALLGTGSRDQISYLNSMPTRHWILALDGDQAGMNATEKLKKKLRSRTMVMPIPPGYDVNDLDKETIKILYSLRR